MSESLETAYDVSADRPRTALEALAECGLDAHQAEAVVHDLALVGWEVRRQACDLTTAKAAALRALADYTGTSDPERPWWNLNMPKALDIMLPAIFRASWNDALADLNVDGCDGCGGPFPLGEKIVVVGGDDRNLYFHPRCVQP